MYKNSRLFLIPFVMIFLLFIQNAFCFEALNGNLDITGFIRNDSAVRLSDGQKQLHGKDVLVSTSDGVTTTEAQGFESGDYYLCRNTLQVEVNWSMTKNLDVFGIWRGFYDAALEINRDFEQNMIDAGSSKEIDGYERDHELREFYVNLTPGNWVFRIGKQQIVWGESDGFRMADIINPLDYSWHYFFPSWEDIRIPLWGVDIMYGIPTGHEYTFEFVWLPGAFNTGFQPNKLAPTGSNWSTGFFNQYFHQGIDMGLAPGMDVMFPGVISGATNPQTGTLQFFMESMEDSVPDNSIKNSELGMKISARYGGFDVSIFDFYCRNDSPVFEEDWFIKFLTGVGGGNLYDFQDEMFQYKWVNKIGATFNVYESITKAVFRGECVYTKDEPFLPRNPFPENALLSFMGMAPPQTIKNYYKDTYAYMLGFDRPTMFPFLNRARSFFISGQIFQKYILDFDDDMTTMDMSNDDVQTLFTLLINTGFRNDTVLPQIFMMYDASGEGWAQPQVEFVYGDYIRFGVGANILLSNDKKQAYFGGMRDNDDIYAWLSFAW